MEIIKTIPVFFYKEESDNEPVREWLLELSHDDRKIIGRDIRIIQMDWPIGYPLVSPLGNGLWEIRSRLDNRISRVLFVFHDGSIVLLHGFIKKTQKTPKNDLVLAIKRAKKL
ncbi:MAG: type II toxin-antitoxin system RelE/ParE family toxin [Candidatus Dependentiae bacterium]|nr:type II toxin-antitoxin system RelE/ParE family toxin [Candidatus Dependentiae bacterium]